MITEHEVNLGLVFHLDPNELETSGAEYSCPEQVRVQGEHFFLCIGADNDGALWLPMFTKPGATRIEVPTLGRTGHPKWTRGTFHFHQEQVWWAPHSAVVRAAVAGHDLSEAGRRNQLSAGSAIRVAQAIPWLFSDIATQASHHIRSMR